LFDTGPVLKVAKGGTGQSSFTNGQLLIGNTTGNTLTKATLTAGTGISITNSTGSITIASSGSGDVVGPSSSTDNALVRFDTTTGKLIQNSVGLLSDAGALSGLTTIDTSNSILITKSSAIILGLASAAAQVSATGTIAISSDGLGSGADTRSGFMFTGRNTSGTIVNILELSGATGATVTKSLGVGATTPSTSGAGITFPATQSASSDANTLDDYEEGTYTPTVDNFTVTGVTTLTGSYTKIGNLVSFNVTFINTGTIAFGVSALVNLPFGGGVANSGCICMWLNSNSAAFNSNQSGTQCNNGEASFGRFFPGSFTTTSAGSQLLFAGTYRIS